MKRLSVSIIALLAVCLSYAQTTNLELADEALQNNEYSSAIYYASEHIQSHPKDAAGYAMRSLALACNEEYTYAFEDADKCIKLWNKKCQYDLATLYGLRARIHEQVQESDKALEDYNLAIKKDKKNPKAYAQRGRFYYRNYDNMSAALDYKKAHDMDPNNTEYTLELARNLWLMDLNDEAAKILDELILYHPRMVEARRIRARIYLEAEDYPSFVDAYATYMDMDRDNESVFVNAAPKAFGYMIKTVSSYIKGAEDEESKYFWLGIRSRVYLEMNQYNEALVDAKAMQTIVTDTVKDGYILLLKSDCYEGLYDFANAKLCYDDLIELYPNTDYTYYYYYKRGNCYSEMGEYAQAESDYQTVIENDMDYALRAYMYRGHMRENQKNYEGAMEDYNKVLLIKEEVSYAYLARGRMYLKWKNDTVSANRDLARVMELEEGEEHSSVRAYALLYMGEADKALSEMEQIIADDPSAGNYYDLACVYSLLNRKEEAVQALSVTFEKGWRHFQHLDMDSDMDNIRNTPEFIQLVNKYRNQ